MLLQRLHPSNHSEFTTFHCLRLHLNFQWQRIASAVDGNDDLRDIDELVVFMEIFCELHIQVSFKIFLKLWIFLIEAICRFCLRSKKGTIGFIPSTDQSFLGVIFTAQIVFSMPLILCNNRCLTNLTMVLCYFFDFCRIRTHRWC